MKIQFYVIYAEVDRIFRSFGVKHNSGRADLFSFPISNSQRLKSEVERQTWVFNILQC